MKAFEFVARLHELMGSGFWMKEIVSQCLMAFKIFTISFLKLSGSAWYCLITS
jgi:hypothetical protein